MDDTLSEDPPVNFDIDRMKASINSGYHELPHGMTIEEMREYICTTACYIKMRDFMLAN